MRLKNTTLSELFQNQKRKIVETETKLIPLTHTFYQVAPLFVKMQIIWASDHLHLHLAQPKISEHPARL